MLDQSKISNTRRALLESQSGNNVDIYEELKTLVNNAVSSIKFDANKEFQSIAVKHSLKMNAQDFAKFVAICIGEGVFVERIKVEESSNDMYYDSHTYLVDAIRVTLI